MHYLNEKDLIIRQLWDMVNRELGKIDDAGCSWSTVGNTTYINNDPEWLVSQDPEIAKFINAINALEGNLISATL